MADALVSICIPTFNRAESLRRAVGSALAQTYAAIEVVISDNASTDHTEQLCTELRARDARVRYLRSPVNKGPTANFNTLFVEARGEFVMMLSDDDWLDRGYVERCLHALRERPDRVLVSGVARYLAGDEIVHGGVVLELEQPDPPSRILEYLRHVDENGLFYGLMSAATLRRAAPLRNALGNDWLLVAAILVQGNATTLQDTAILRELGGTSSDIPKLVGTLGLPRWQGRLPHLVIARELASEVAWRNHAFAVLPFAARLRLALACARAVLDWRSDAWHLTQPTFAAIGSRRRGGLLWRCYLRLARRAGATHAGNDT
jgi:glycosyltransferase involved in cell wall biosynthesis